ncbi:MAG: hypothetical protein OXM55_08780 [Bdellovibrionales bacterium]|nr:hypothetical protein [Bdellovibrionales bacterium]
MTIIIFTLFFLGCGGKGSKERCEAKEGHWEWKEIEKRCEEKGLVRTSEECEAKGGMWNSLTYQCHNRGGEEKPPGTPEEATEISQAECETPEKKREGFGLVQGRCKEKAQYIIYSYMQDSTLQISSGRDSVQLQPWTTGPDCVRIKRSQWAFLKITTRDLLITICDNTDDNKDNNCKISPSIYNEKEGTHKYRVQLWSDFASQRSTIKFLFDGHTDKDINECKVLGLDS